MTLSRTTVNLLVALAAGIVVMVVAGLVTRSAAVVFACTGLLTILCGFIGAFLSEDLSRNANSRS